MPLYHRPVITWPCTDDFCPAGDPEGSILAQTPAAYRPRHPERAGFYHLFETHFDSYVRVHEERFEAPSGPLRPVVARSVGRIGGIGCLMFSAYSERAPLQADLSAADKMKYGLQSSLRSSLLGSYLGLDFAAEGRSLILHGKTGRGKTHLAVAIGSRAIQKGFETRFTTAAQLVEDLSNASRRGELHNALESYTHPHVLIVDEVGYLTYGPDAANVLYHVVNDRHLKKRPMVFTTNKSRNEWGRVLHDSDLAEAILDRILERGRWITLDGPSGRTRHLKLETALPQDHDGAGISGKSVPEFPEPTFRTSTRCRK
jgi:DNA replication protein DnaC